MVRCIIGTLSMLFLAAGVLSLAVLIKIGGKSDGPGALLFSIGLFVGLGGGVTMLFSLPPRN